MSIKLHGVTLAENIWRTHLVWSEIRDESVASPHTNAAMAALLRSPGAKLRRSSWTPLQRVQTQNSCCPARTGETRTAAEGGRRR